MISCFHCNAIFSFGMISHRHVHFQKVISSGTIWLIASVQCISSFDDVDKNSQILTSVSDSMDIWTKNNVDIRDLFFVPTTDMQFEWKTLKWLEKLFLWKAVRIKLHNQLHQEDISHSIIYCDAFISGSQREEQFNLIR